MEQSKKELWLSKMKSGKLAVIQSANAPVNTNCIWLKNGTLYGYENTGWEEFSTANNGGGGGSSIFGNMTLPIKFDVEFTGMDDGGGDGTRDVPTATFTANPKGYYLLPHVVVDNNSNVKLCPYLVIRQKYAYHWDDGGGGVIKNPIDAQGLEKAEAKEETKENTRKLPVLEAKSGEDSSPKYIFFIKRLLQYCEHGSVPEIELYFNTYNTPYFSGVTNTFVEDVPLGDEPGWEFNLEPQVKSAFLDKNTAIKEMTVQGIPQEQIDAYINMSTEIYGLGPDGTVNKMTFTCSPYVFEMVGNYGPEGDPEAMLVWGDEQSYFSGANLRGIPESWATYMEETPNCVVSYYAQNI